MLGLLGTAIAAATAAAKAAQSSKSSSSSGGGGGSYTGGGGSSSGGSSSGGKTYTEGSLSYRQNPDGSVTKYDASTGRTVTIPKGDPRMAYVPSAVGGSRQDTSSSGSTYTSPGTSTFTGGFTSGPAGVALDAALSVPLGLAMGVLSGGAATTQYTQDQWRAQTEEAINRLLEEVANLRQPSVTIPEIPTYTPPQVPTLTWDEALARAREMVEPLAEAARQRTLEMFQEKRERLPYELAARGQLGPAGLENAMEGLTQAQARALNEIDLQKLAQAMETARMLQSSSEAQAAAQLARDWQQWLGQTQLGLQQGQLSAQEQWRQYDAQVNRLAQLMQWLLQQQGLERADEWAAAQAALQLGVTPNLLMNIWQLMGSYPTVQL